MQSDDLVNPLTERISTLSPTPVHVHDILANVVKPLFTATPHPRLHTETARVLARPADSQDPFHRQPWKDHPGLDEVIRWCILNTQPAYYEQTWHLLLPPIMTFLDDYQVSFKIRGVYLVSNLLTRVPPELLLRTGVDGLLFTSLTNALNHIRDDSTPELIRAVVPTTIQLIDLTTPSQFPDATSPSPPSLSPSVNNSLSTRFTRLSTLLSSSILGTVIMYTPAVLPPDRVPVPDTFADPEHTESDSESVPLHSVQATPPERNAPHPTLVAAADALPLVIAALGIGAARFLKGIVPVVTGWLALPIPTATSPSSVVGENIGMVTATSDKDKPLQANQNGPFSLHLAALRIIHVLLDACAPRIEQWAVTIIDGMARCWVGCMDATSAHIQLTGVEKLQNCLQETAVKLSSRCPSVIQNDFKQLLDFDSTLFDGLVGNIL